MYYEIEKYYNKCVIQHTICQGESIVLGSNFRNGDLDGFTRFEVP